MALLHRVLVCLVLLISSQTEIRGQEVITITGEFTAAGDLEVGPDGNIYVADFGSSLGGGTPGPNVYRVTPQGDVTVFATGFLGASGNAFDSVGNLYQSNIGAGAINRITPDGTVSVFAQGNGIAGPIGVAVDAAGNVFNTNCGQNTITKTTVARVTTVFAANSLFRCPNGLTIDADDNLYTSNFNNCNVMKITPAGEVSRIGCASTFATPNVGNGHLTYANERLYVAGWRSGVIFEMPLDGTPVSVLAGAGGSGREDGAADVARFHQPNGIDATPSGDTLYVNDTVNLSSNGTLLYPNVVRMITGVKGTITASEIERPEVHSVSLDGVYPNPVAGTVNAEYVLGQNETLRLDLVDVMGRTLHVLDEGLRTPGRHRVALDASTLAPGTYYFRLTASGSVTTKSVIVAR